MPDRDVIWRFTREACIAYFSNGNCARARDSDLPRRSWHARRRCGAFGGGVTGWAIGDGAAHEFQADAASLYEKLEHTVLPTYHNDRRAWVAIMKGSIAKCASLFNSHRMMRRYAEDAYLR